VTTVPIEEYAAERFRKDAEGHEMTVRRDAGVYRHLTFKRPDSNHYRFDLVTWPGYLAITGDMGDTYTFSRLNDMFEFFRSNPDRPSINPRYWGEKLQHPVRGGRGPLHSVQDFSKQVLEKAVREQVAEIIEYSSWAPDVQSEFREEVEQRLAMVESEHDLDELHFYFDPSPVTAPEVGQWCFEEFYDLPCEEWSFPFLWVCHAIAWGIAQYDKATEVALP
jgi:hypothetical protein